MLYFYAALAGLFVFVVSYGITDFHEWDRMMNERQLARLARQLEIDTMATYPDSGLAMPPPPRIAPPPPPPPNLPLLGELATNLERGGVERIAEWIK